MPIIPENEITYLGAVTVGRVLYAHDVRVCVIGCGYLGAVHAACMAELGHDVVGVDVDAARIATLAGGRAPFVEPGLETLLEQHLAAGHLTFTTELTAARDAEVYFIGVGTPEGEGGAADLGALESVVSALADLLADGRPTTSPAARPLVVGTSTVPVGTAARLAGALRRAGAELVWSPEFLREGHAVADTLRPDHLVYGLPEDARSAAWAGERLDAVYAPLLEAGVPRFAMDYATAELVKVSANAFLAMKVSFINAVAQLCQASGADVSVLAQAIGMDERIGPRNLQAGLGYGGGCLPKDVRALRARAAELGAGGLASLMEVVDAVNESMPVLAVERARALVGELAGLSVAVLGASFKPGSDDVRRSPSVRLATLLAADGARVRLHDPVALPGLADRDDLRASGVRLEPDLEAALAGADLVVLATAWPEYRELDPAWAGQRVAQRRVLDARNALDAATWAAAGWRCDGMGGSHSWHLPGLRTSAVPDGGTTCPHAS